MNSALTGLVIINEIYNRSDILEDLNRPIFIALPRKAGANEPKLIIQILMNTLRSRIRLEIGH